MLNRKYSVRKFETWTSGKIYCILLTIAQVVFHKKVFFIVPINCAFQPIDVRAKYRVADPDLDSELGSGSKTRGVN